VSKAKQSSQGDDLMKNLFTFLPELSIPTARFGAEWSKQHD